MLLTEMTKTVLVVLCCVNLVRLGLCFLGFSSLYGSGLGLTKRKKFMRSARHK